MRGLSQALLDWFDRQARVLPWRVPAGGGLRRDPYSVLVSEFMLQQTQVVTVIPYYQRFMARFPDLPSLAAAEEGEVLKVWEGLGYYRRARQLHLLARVLLAEHGGLLPRDPEVLVKLPGIGPYSAGALLSLAYDLAYPAVDGNVVRVFARLDALPHQQGEARAQREVRDRVLGLIPPERPGDFNEALIELGATLCTRTEPACLDCPVRGFCRALAMDRVEAFPLKAKGKPKPVSPLTYLLLQEGSRVYCRRRSAGLLAGLYEFLPLVGRMGPQDLDDLHAALAQAGGGECLVEEASFRGEKRAVFSHRVWEMAFWEVTLAAPCLEGQGFELVDHDQLARLPLPAFLASWRDDFLARAKG